MMKEREPESLNCREEVIATSRIVGQIHEIQSTNNLEIWASLWGMAAWREYMALWGGRG